VNVTDDDTGVVEAHGLAIARADEKWDGLDDTRHTERNVVERDRGHGQVVYVRDT